MRKNISIILDGYLPDKRVEREAKTLAEAGHKVSLFCFTNDSTEYRIKGVNIQSYPPSFIIKKAQAIAIDLPIYHLFLRGAIRRFLIETQPDIIHVHDMTIAGLVFQLKTYEKIVLDLHENRPEIMAFYPHIKKPLGRMLISLKRWKRAEARYVQKADHLILVTNEAKNDYFHLNEEITVLPNTIEKQEVEGIEPDPTILKRFQPHFVITYVGDLGKRRGIFDILKAINILKKRVPNIKLVLVGDSTERHLYETYVEENELDSFVSFEGFQPHKKLFSYILASKIGISPLHRNKHHDTTYANKIFQYMAMGKSQVVSDCPAQKNLIESEKVGFSYPSGDEKRLADIIYELYENEPLRSEMEQRAFKAFQTKYNWEQQKRPLLEIYDSFV